MKKHYRFALSVLLSTVLAVTTLNFIDDEPVRKFTGGFNTQLVKTDACR